MGTPKIKSKLRRLIENAERNGAWLYNPTSEWCMSPKELRERLANEAGPNFKSSSVVGSLRFRHLTWEVKKPQSVLLQMVASIHEEISSLQILCARMRAEGIGPEYCTALEAMEVNLEVVLPKMFGATPQLTPVTLDPVSDAAIPQVRSREIICGDCAGEAEEPRVTLETSDNTCAGCGGRNYVPAQRPLTTTERTDQ